jgi:hypothetical protein
MTDDPQHIIDRSDLRKYRTELPNLYDDAGLDVFEFRLLAHYKRVGTCNEGLETTARKCKMSEGSASQKRTSLAKKKWIKLTPIMTVHGPGYSVEVIDRWEENFRNYSRKPSPHEGKPSPHEAKPSPHEGKPSPHEAKPSPGEGKKEPIKKEPPKKTSPPTPLPPPKRQVATVVAGGVAIVESSWSLRSIPNIPAQRVSAVQAHGPEKLIALYLYYLTQSGIKSPLRTALARLDRGEIDPGQIFDQLGALPPASLAILLNWIAEGASDYTTADLNGAAMLGHAFAELFKQPPAGIQSRPQQERQAEAEQQTIRSVAVHALTDLNLWRLLPTIEPPPSTTPDVTMGTGSQEPSPDVTMPTVSPLWQAALDQLWLEMSHATFDAWLRDTDLITVGPDEFVIGVPSTHARDWLANRMSKTIERTLARTTGQLLPVKFTVKGK